MSDTDAAVGRAVRGILYLVGVQLKIAFWIFKFIFGRDVLWISNVA